MSSGEELYLPPPTKWPESAPSRKQEAIISIVCGNSNIHWAFHDGFSQRFAPTLFWRTPLLTQEELDAGPSEALSRFLPETAHDVIFGHNEQPTKENAHLRASSRPVPNINVYIVSSNDKQVERINFIWKEIPSRLYMMQGEDFFSAADGRYDTMGVDRLAVLSAAGSLVGFPALVFDGGTALTYTAADNNGKILGGGITLGLGAKLHFLSDATGALPSVSLKETADHVTKAERGKPIGPFCTDTKSAILSSSLQEIACAAKATIKHWLQQVGPDVSTISSEEMSSDDGTGEATAISDADKSGGDGARREEMKTSGLKIVAGRKRDKEGKNNRRAVLVTGGDADILRKLLEPDHSGVLAREPGNPGPAGYEVQKIKHMIHYGVAAVLEKKIELGETDPIQQEWETALLGQRVAKKFPIPDVDGDYIFRGTIQAVEMGKDRSQDWFKIVYDDDDSEQLDIAELHGTLVLYSKVGEKEIDEEANQKKQASKAASDRVALERRKIEEENAKQAAKKAAAASTPSVPAAGKGSGKKRPPEPSKTTSKRSKKAVTPSQDPHSFKDARIAKKFGSDIFFGTITDYESSGEESGSEDEGGLWRIDYDDGDTEQYDEDDLKKALALFEKWKHTDPKSGAVGGAAIEIDNDTPDEPAEKEEAEVVEMDKDSAVASDDGRKTSADSGEMQLDGAETKQAAIESTGTEQENPDENEKSNEKVPSNSPVPTPAPAPAPTPAPALVSAPALVPAPAPAGADAMEISNSSGDGNADLL